MILGLTGFLCSGKSTASEFFRTNGWTVIDVDRIGHEVLQDKKILKTVVCKFGPSVLDAKGMLARKQLGKLVFASRNSLSALNKILHPKMISEVRKRLASRKGKKVLIDAALLFPMGLDRLCDLVLSVEVPKQILMARARGRGLSAQSARNILSAQKPARSASARTDIRIRNDSTLRVFRKRLTAVLKMLEQLEA